MKRRSISKGSCSRASPIRSRAADLGTEGGFLRQGNTRAAVKPTRSCQLSPHLPKAAWGALVTRSAATRADRLGGASERVWCGCGRGRACRKGIVTLPARGVSSTSGHHPLSLAVVSTRQKVTASLLTRLGVTTQRELPRKRAATQVSVPGSQSLSLGPDGSSENSCVRRDHVGHLLSLMAELWEEV